MTDDDLVSRIEQGLVDRDQDKPIKAKQTCSMCGIVGHSRRVCPALGRQRQPRHRRR
jgi:hypothetical protein